MGRRAIDPEEKKRRKREYAKQYYAEHREEVKERNRMIMKQRFSEDPEKIRERNRAHYHLYREKYRKMVALEELERRTLEMLNDDPDGEFYDCVETSI